MWNVHQSAWRNLYGTDVGSVASCTLRTCRIVSDLPTPCLPPEPTKPVRHSSNGVAKDFRVEPGHISPESEGHELPRPPASARGPFAGRRREDPRSELQVLTNTVREQP